MHVEVGNRIRCLLPLIVHPLRRVHGRTPGMVDIAELRIAPGERWRISAASVEPHRAEVGGARWTESRCVTIWLFCGLAAGDEEGPKPMNRTSPSTAGPDDALGLFPNDAEWVRTQVLDARAIGTCEFDLDEFAQYRRIRILTYSSSVQMLSTVLDRFEKASVECVLGYSRAVNDMAAIVALQTATMEDVRSALLGLSAQRREAILKRVREGRLQVRVVEGHVSHAKIFLLSDGTEGAHGPSFGIGWILRA